MTSPVARLARYGHVIVCAGPGGVGKTTCAAAIALAAARAGRRACVVTIDPAKRLADALGLESLTNEAVRVDIGCPGAATAGTDSTGGGLWALMLDTKSTFDEVVDRNAQTPEQARAILDNKLYRNISGALGGTQEYMAMEKLFELHSSARFDLLVVDTPPTRHALDFLDAPGRLLRFLDNRIFRLLMMPTRAGLRALGMATQVFLRTLSKVVGSAVVADTVAFFEAFEGMEQGFRDRAAKVQELLDDSGTAFIVIAAPRRDAIAEAVYFADRLRESSAGVGALVVNRMFPTFGPAPESLRVGTSDRDGGAPAPGCSGEPPAPDPDAAVRALAVNIDDFYRISVREEAHIAELAERLPGSPIVRVPFLSSDVHDLRGLDEIAGWLFGDAGEHA